MPQPRVDEPTRPFVAASAAADAAVASRLDALVETARRAAGAQLRGVVLAGSLARGQGVVLERSEGPALLSDLDLYFVMKQAPFDPGPLRRALDETLAGDSFLLTRPDIGIVGPDYFQTLGPVLPAFQLAHRHRVLWSDATAGDEWARPPLDPERGRVDPADALRLLHNRMAESLALRRRLDQDPEAPEALYALWKLWWDAPLAWLCVQGRYDPRRSVQQQTLDEIASELRGAAAELMTSATQALKSRWQRLGQPLTLDQLKAGAAVAGKDATLRDRWVWVLYRATLAGCRAGSPGPGAGFAQAVEAGAPGSDDVDAGRRWLLREAWPRRLRTARRWVTLAPLAVTPWWQHGWGGTGPDRVATAVSWRFARLPGWRDPLRQLISTSDVVAEESSEAALDGWIADLWIEWISGRGQG